jgi:hypothetical protein
MIDEEENKEQLEELEEELARK